MALTLTQFAVLLVWCQGRNLLARAVQRKIVYFLFCFNLFPIIKLSRRPQWGHSTTRHLLVELWNGSKVLIVVVANFVVHYSLDFV